AALESDLAEVLPHGPRRVGLEEPGRRAAQAVPPHRRRTMRIRDLHPWELTPAEAVALQRELAGQVDTRSPLTQCRLVAGVDVSYARFCDRFFAGIVVLELPGLNVVERVGAVRVTPFPYIPGLLSFREAPALLEAFARLQSTPDAVMVDG